MMEAVSEDEAQRRLDREMKFDSDIWIVEIESTVHPIAELLRISPP
jgi:hypothetical protein